MADSDTPVADGTSESPRKVAIVGSANTSRDLAPFADPSWEIWTLNDMYHLVPRVDRFFELHTPEVVLAEASTSPDQLAWMRTNADVPKVLMHEIPGVLNFTLYPHDAILKDMGRYFTNSISWMLALALYEGVEEVNIFGVDMAHGTEYAAQRPSCEYMIGIARGRGMSVGIPSTSDLLKTPFLYGLENPPMALTSFDNRYAKLSEQLAEFQRVKLEAMLNEAKASGAMEMLAYIRTAWTQEQGASHIPLAQGA